MVGCVRGDDVPVVGGLDPVEFAPDHGHPADGGVDVGVVEPGEEGPSLQVESLTGRSRTPSCRGDLAVLDRDPVDVLPGPGPDRTTGEDEIGHAHES